MFFYHCTIEWQSRICDSLYCLFYLTIVFFILYVCLSSFSLFDKSLSSGVATMLLLLLFLTFHFPYACYNV